MHLEIDGSRAKIGFSAAHMISFHEGKCKNLHGHRWTIYAKIFNVKVGQFIDFIKIKQFLRKTSDSFDHTIILNEEIAEGNELRGHMICYGEYSFPRNEVTLIDGEPTAENLALIFAEKFGRFLKKNGWHYHFAIGIEEGLGSIAWHEGKA